MDRPAQSTFDLTTTFVHLEPSGDAQLLEVGDGRPPDVEGRLAGAAHLTESPPHGGEVHVDGDELLYLVSGAVDIIVEEDNGERVIELRPRQAFLVPRGSWHHLRVREPSELLFFTPGRSHARPRSTG